MLRFTMAAVAVTLALARVGVAQGVRGKDKMSSERCSYAGTVNATGDCDCFAGFQGPHCEALGNSTVIPIESGFRMKEYHVWGSQVVKRDGKFVMAASIYPADMDFFTHWLTNAQVILATSPNITGPFEAGPIILPYHETSNISQPQPWDRSSMNPKLLYHPHSSSYLLFYTGDTYTGPRPTPANHGADNNEEQASQMIGMAVAKSIMGPYERRSAPVLQPRPGKWDSRMVTNPTVIALNNGSLLMIYKASNPAGANNKQTQVCFGVALAETVDSPFLRSRDDPIIPCPTNTFYAEDATLFQLPDGSFHLIFKDFDGHFTHDGYSGAHAVSLDGLHWNLTSPALAYTTEHMWSDGKMRKQGHQERPQILLGDDGYPEAIYYATDTELDGSTKKMWNMVQPLR